MVKHDEPELRIIEVPGTLSSRAQLKVKPPKRERSDPTAAEALAAIRSMKGGSAVIERLPGLGNISLWREVAFWGVCESRGDAVVDLLFWDCDFPGEFDFPFANANCLVYFFGTDQLGTVEGTITPPTPPDGQVWCYFEAPSDGAYAFGAHVVSAVEPPGYMATLEFWMDGKSIGTRTLNEGVTRSGVQYFVFNLSKGLHLFQITQCDNFFAFFSVTAWHIAILHA